MRFNSKVRNELCVGACILGISANAWSFLQTRQLMAQYGNITLAEKIQSDFYTQGMLGRTLYHISAPGRKMARWYHEQNEPYLQK